MDVTLDAGEEDEAAGAAVADVRVDGEVASGRARDTVGGRAGDTGNNVEDGVGRRGHGLIETGSCDKRTDRMQIWVAAVGGGRRRGRGRLAMGGLRRMRGTRCTGLWKAQRTLRSLVFHRVLQIEIQHYAIQSSHTPDL